MYDYYRNKECHIVVFVGYHDNSSDPDDGYWIIKNSYGSSWGDAGYGKIAYGSCMIEYKLFYFEPNVFGIFFSVSCIFGSSLLSGIG